MDGVSVIDPTLPGSCGRLGGRPKRSGPKALRRKSTARSGEAGVGRPKSCPAPHVSTRRVQETHYPLDLSWRTISSMKDNRPHAISLTRARPHARSVFRFSAPGAPPVSAPTSLDEPCEAGITVDDAVDEIGHRVLQLLGSVWRKDVLTPASLLAVSPVPLQRRLDLGADGTRALATYLVRNLRRILVAEMSNAVGVDLSWPILARSCVLWLRNY